MYPKYHVSWKKDNVCSACGFRSSEEFTWGFSTQEAAMDQAIFILTQGQALGYTLLFIEL